MNQSRMILAAMLPLFLTAACFDDASSDGDGDGEGVGSGANPFGGGGGGGSSSADDDADGFTNGDEDAAGTNPDYAYSHPYIEAYNVGYCEDGVAEATGPTATSSYGYPMYQAGDVAENFSLMDKNGEMVDLYSFCGKTIMLVSSAFW